MSTWTRVIASPPPPGVAEQLDAMQKFGKGFPCHDPCVEREHLVSPLQTPISLSIYSAFGIIGGFVYFCSET